MQRTRTIIFTIGLIGVFTSIYSHQVPYAHPPVPGLPDPIDPTTARITTTTAAPKGPQYLDNYLPPVMQALAYYVELLQYEPAQTTTIEPPFMGFEAEGGTTYTPPKTTPTTTTPSAWRPTTPSTTITTTATSTTKKPSTIWWSPPMTSRKTTIITTTTTTRAPTVMTTVKPTPSHKPGYYAPTPWYSRPHSRPSNKPTNRSTNRPINRPTNRPTNKPTHYHDPPFMATTSSAEKDREELVTPSIDTDKNNFFDWLFQNKAKQLQPDPATEYDFQRLDPLPGGLLQDILYERYELPALLDKDNVNEFLRVYDDNFGRYRPISGKKRIPPTKPYVGFLMLYDLLKREAKAMGFSKFEGYSPSMLRELAETSKRSAERQLHILMTRMLARHDVERSDVVTRVKAILKDLEDPNSVTSKSLIYIPTLQFVP